MRSRLALVVSCLLVPSLLPIVLAQQPVATSEPSVASTLRTAEEDLARGLVSSDAAVFERLLADDFVLRGAPDVDRATWIANAVSLCWGKTFEIDAFTVRGHTDTEALVTYVLTTALDPATCEPAIVRSLVTDIWRRDAAGAWRLALRHSGPAGGDVTTQFARTDPPPPRWERTGELSFVGTGGNTDTQTVGVGGSVLWRPGAWVTQARVAYVRSATDDVDTAESLVVDLRQSRELTPRLDVRGNAAFLVDRFAGIDHRTVVDGGIGWLVADRAGHSFKVDVGAGVTREVRLASEDLTFPVGTFGARYRWQLSRTSELTNDTLVTADLSDADNWRLQNGLNLTVSMTRLLSVKVGHQLRRINQPVPGFQPTDTVMSAALVAKF